MSAWIRSINASSGSLPAVRGNLIEPASLIGRQLRLVEGRNENTGRTTGPQVLVFPTRICTQHIRLDALTYRGIGEAREQRPASAFTGPHGQVGVEPVGSGRIGILIGRNVKAFGTRTLEARKHLWHPAPVLSVGGLQMMDRRRDRGLASNAKHLVETRIDLIGFQRWCVMYDPP